MPNSDHDELCKIAKFDDEQNALKELKLISEEISEDLRKEEAKAYKISDDLKVKLKDLGFLFDKELVNAKPVKSEITKLTAKTSANFIRYDEILKSKSRKFNPAEQISKTNPSYRELSSPDDIRIFFAELTQKTAFGYDIETSSLSSLDGRILTHQFSHTPNSAVLIRQSVLDANPSILELFLSILANDKITKIIHNAKFEYSFLNYCLRHNDYFLTLNNLFDTLIAAQFINENRPLGLKALAHSELNIDMIEFDEVTYGSLSYDPDAPYALEYACADADIALQLYHKYKPIIDAGGSSYELLKMPHISYTNSFYQLEMPLVQVLSQMEHDGMLINIGLLERMRSECIPELARLKQEIIDAVGDNNFNPDSAKQLETYLYDTLKLPVLEWTKGGKNKIKARSTSVKLLEILLKEHPHPMLKPLVDYSHLSQFKSLYLDGIPKAFNPVTCSVHTQLNQTGTVTGRFSSSNPNLQNLRKNQDD